MNIQSRFPRRNIKWKPIAIIDGRKQVITAYLLSGGETKLSIFRLDSLTTKL